MIKGPTDSFFSCLTAPKYTSYKIILWRQKWIPPKQFVSFTLGSFCTPRPAIRAIPQNLRTKYWDRHYATTVIGCCPKKIPQKRGPLVHFQIGVGRSPLHLHFNFCHDKTQKCHTNSPVISTNIAVYLSNQNDHPGPPTITTSQVPLRFVDIPSIYPSASATWPVNCIRIGSWSTSSGGKCLSVWLM